MPFATVHYKEATDTDIARAICRFDGIPTCEQEVTTYLNELDAIYKKNEPFHLLYDAEKIGRLPYEYIQKQSEFMRSRDSTTRQLVLRCAIIITSPITRMMLDALFFINKPACKELQICNNMNTAVYFLCNGETKKKKGKVKK
jgi:hypothetical protein